MRSPGDVRSGASLPPAGPIQTQQRRVRLRLMLTALGICSWCMVVVGRLVELQVFGRPGYERQAARQSERTINLDPRRGAILDRDGRSLALSVDSESLYAVPQVIRDAEGVAGALAGPLHLDPAERRDLIAQLRKNRAFIWVRRKLDPDTVAAVRALQLEGVGFLTENRRYYPSRDLAAHVLGYVSLDNQGMGGIEQRFEDDLRGRAAKVMVRTDARRRPMGHTERPSTEGHNVVLTIDSVIQHAAERELERAILETGAQAGTAIVMDPRTGEVLALANRPDYNPNRYAAYPAARWRNRAVSEFFEPGSVFKIFTAAAGVQEKVVSLDEVLDCGNGSIEIAGTIIHDHSIYSLLSFRDVIAKSSDVGTVRVAQRLGTERFDRYVRAFGFGVPTGVMLPGESGGLLRPTTRWSALSLPTLSFGQEVGVTQLQLASGIAVIANGGYLMKPMLVRRVEDQDGKVLKTFRPEAVRRVLEPETVDQVTELMKGVVQHGTGRQAAIPGYTVAGKTGTAQKIDANGRYSMVDHVASFVGFAPASRPAILVLTSLDTPRGARNEAGDVAAPLFARIADAALRRLAVPAEDSERVLRVSLPSEEALMPAAYVPSAVANPAPPPDHLMPDLHGRSAREAAMIAARYGLVVDLAGSGTVVDQSPAAGTEVDAGTTCRLSLRLPAEMAAEAARAARVAGLEAGGAR